MPAVSNETWIQRNNVEANFGCFQRIFVFGVSFLVVKNILLQDTSQGGSQEMWKTQAAHLSLENDDCIFEFENYYIFVFATEANEETANENDDVLEENYITVFVLTINGKAISSECYELG